VAVVERQKSKRLHFHLVVVLASDIRTGFDFEGIQRRDYRSANTAIRNEWSFWRRTAPDYGFGRTELLPVKSTAEGIARYVGKYISKHIGQRLQADKGSKLVRYINFKPGDRTCSLKFSWNTIGGRLWRFKLGKFCESHGHRDTDFLRDLAGPRWAYLLQDQFISIPVPDFVYPSREAAERSLLEQTRREMALDWAQHQLEKKSTRTRTMLLSSTKRFQPRAVTLK